MRTTNNQVLNKPIFFLIFFFLINFNAFSQCNSFFNLKDGAKFVMETFNAKDKKTGSILNYVKNINRNGNNFEAEIESTTFDQKNKEQNKGTYSISCENGQIKMDLKKIIPQESLAAYENMDVNFSGEDLIIPPSLQVDEKLKDGKIKGEVKDKNSNSILSTFEFTITDRTVTGKETVVTPAGSFECYRISYNMSLNTNMMGINIPVNMKAVEYITEDVGIVKSEFYNKNGKLGGYSVLAKVE